jgi:sec-independent protein translocase protein TatC
MFPKRKGLMMSRPPSDEELPIGEHFRELRRRLMMVVGAILIAFFITYGFAGHVYQFLVAPLADLYEGQENRRLIYTGLTEAFFAYIKVSFFSAFILAFPIIAYHLYKFLAPGLYKKEKVFLAPFLIASPVLFLMGAAMAYYFVFPLAWSFFLSFEEFGGGGQLPIQLEARVSEYLALVIHIILAFGLAFQMPIILTLLAKAGFITADSLRKKRKYAVLCVFILAAVITPPDVVSQIGLAVPLLLLYECSIFVSGLLEPKKEKEEEKIDA